MSDTHVLVCDLSNLCYIAAKSSERQGTTGHEAYYDSVLSYLRRQYRYFRPDHVVFACDHEAEYWRKIKFPAYKAQREDNDFKREMRDVIKRFKTENAHLCLEHPGCEADDIIYALATMTPYRLTIMSSDGDFAQLINERVRVFHPQQFSFREREKNVALELFVKCIRGDRSDNIPAVLPMVPRRRLQEVFRHASPIEALQAHYRFHEHLHTDYERNRELIDLSCLPDEFKTALALKITAFFAKEQNSDGI